MFVKRCFRRIASEILDRTKSKTALHELGSRHRPSLTSLNSSLASTASLLQCRSLSNFGQDVVRRGSPSCSFYPSPSTPSVRTFTSAREAEGAEKKATNNKGSQAGETTSSTLGSNSMSEAEQQSSSSASAASSTTSTTSSDSCTSSSSPDQDSLQQLPIEKLLIERRKREWMELYPEKDIRMVSVTN